MAATINETQAIDAVPPIAVEETEVSDATRIARYCTLEELPGLIFGVMTVGYIVLSLAGLAP
jgi:hypothetical protein